MDPSLAQQIQVWFDKLSGEWRIRWFMPFRFSLVLLARLLLQVPLIFVAGLLITTYVYRFSVITLSLFLLWNFGLKVMTSSFENFEYDTTGVSNSAFGAFGLLSGLIFAWASAIEKDDYDYKKLIDIGRRFLLGSMIFLVASGIKYSIIKWGSLNPKEIFFTDRIYYKLGKYGVPSLFIGAALELWHPIFEFNQLLWRRYGIKTTVLRNGWDMLQFSVTLKSRNKFDLNKKPF